jgi:hypothetical protein
MHTVPLLFEHQAELIEYLQWNRRDSRHTHVCRRVLVHCCKQNDSDLISLPRNGGLVRQSKPNNQFGEHIQLKLCLRGENPIDDELESPP